MSPVDAARGIIERAIAGRIFPAAGVEVGASRGTLWSGAFGTLTFDAGSPAAGVETPFDLASLTKPIATTTVIMELIETGRLRLDDPVSLFFEDWRGADRSNVTLRDLLEHASGLAARLVDPPPQTRREFEHEICRMPLEYAPRTQSLYSDLDFILLGFLAADRGGASLSELFERFTARLNTATSSRDAPGADISAGPGDPGGLPSLTFSLPPALKPLAAPTQPLAEDRRRGRLLAGEVHDDYAAALGGTAGHAGLFGSASDVATFARAVLRAARGEADAPPPLSPARIAAFTAKSAVPGSSRALGWDTMRPTSSCGARMSPEAFGHVGFTGTSLWIDPGRDRYFVLLTNRACGGGSLDDMRAVRRSFHDALATF